MPLWALLFYLFGTLALESGYASLRQRRPVSYLWLSLALIPWLWGWMLTGHPLLVSCLLLAGQGGLVAFHRVKAVSLREPLVWADVFLLRQALKHPQLYFAFVPAAVWRLLGGAVLLGAVLLLWLEPAFWMSGPARAGVVGVTVLMALAIWLNRRLLARIWLARLTRDSREDIRQWGGLPSLFGYWLAVPYSQPDGEASLFHRWQPVALRKESLPHLVAVQSESFHDLRRWNLPGLPPELYRQWDGLKALSSRHGLADVPSFGANTMRAEFMFLTGIPFAAQGISGYNPYLSATVRRGEMPSLFRLLKAQGYRSLCLHPFDGDFFRRRRILLRMGLDAMEDERDFAGAPRIGPYIGDAALLERMHQRLDAAKEPLFLFAITMESHGPWLRGRFADVDGALGAYQRHLVNAQAMLASLMQRQDCKGCWYGDHVPSFPDLAPPKPGFGEPVDFLTWGGSPPGGAARHIAMEGLATLWLGDIGLISSER